MYSADETLFNTLGLHAREKGAPTKRGGVFW